MAENLTSTLRRLIPPASSAAATPIASGRFDRNTAPTSAADTEPLNSVSPTAIDSGIPSSTMPTVRLRVVVASAPEGTAVSPATSSAASTGSSGSSRSERRSSHVVSP